MILSPQRVSGGAMDEVWSSVARADSAARGVAASADSLARLAAMAEAQRQRQMDSLRTVLGMPDPDSLRADSVRVDSLRADSVARDSASAAARPRGRT
jgi:hypothetical protein